ncbi:MAG: hypothetical protein PF517_14645 [Salinivirgaceae bacterium]|jgi:hypothetical protein|nr:hypothetical protein [Salinivirgaceae bacterium]
MKISSNFDEVNIGEQFRCFSQTLDRPLKQNTNLPNLIFGWSLARSKKFGESLLIPYYLLLTIFNL